eukprot:366768-Pelagomonas_calceolata.AAC.1
MAGWGIHVARWCADLSRTKERLFGFLRLYPKFTCARPLKASQRRMRGCPCGCTLKPPMRMPE